MNPLLRKELRLLAPAWAVALLAVATNFIWSYQDFQVFAEFVFSLAVVILGLAPFGQELSCGTFGLLLAQPEKRQRFWRVKVGLLALALLSVWGLFVASLFHQYHNAPQLEEVLAPLWAVARQTLLLALLAFSGGLWSTLLFREVTTAFFATVLTPIALWGLTAFLSGGFDQTDEIALVLGAYSLIGFAVAWRLLLGAQDAAWTGGQVTLASIRGGPYRWLASGFQKRRGPYFAMFYKELQLQEVTMVMVPLLLLFHLAALAVRHFSRGWTFLSPVVHDVPFAWMLTVPVVVGGVAVAEERRFNTLEGQLCLPTRKRVQFAAKFLVVMVLGTVLGAVVPWGLENLGLCQSGYAGLQSLHGMLNIAAIITSISFFASTISRSMFQSIVVGLSSVIMVILALNIFVDQSPGIYRLFMVNVWPVLIPVYFWLAFRNYQRLQTGWRLWIENLLGLLAAFAVVVVLLLAASAMFVVLSA